MLSRDDSPTRMIRQLERRVADLERAIAGVRAKREPLLRDKRTRYKAIVTEAGGIAAGGSGEVTIYLAQAVTTWKPTAWLNWMDGGQPVDEDAQVIVEFFPDENRFVIVGAECTAGGSSEPTPLPPPEEPP